MQLIKEHGEGTQVTLELKDQKIACVIKNVDYDSMKKDYGWISRHWSRERAYP